MRGEPAREGPVQRLLASAVGALVRFVGALPEPIAYGIADLLALPWAAYWALKDRRGRRSKGYWRNCRIAFREGGLGPRPKGHLLAFSRHLTWLLVDFCRMRRITKRNIERHCDLSEFPRLAELHAKGKGIVFATAHVGPWDIAGWAAGLLGLPITSVYRPSPLPAVDRAIARARVGTGQDLAAKRGAVFALKKALAEGRTVGMLCDVGAKGSDLFAPFLGTNASTIGTPALLHLWTGAPIAVVTVERTARMRFRLRVWDVIEREPGADRRADVLAIATRINDGISRAIAERPAQWFWHGRRFRHRPPGEVPLPDGLPPLAEPRAARPCE
ncbi:MAG: hypothetical protein Fur0037_21190 [Planctomycetota bacterium]